MPTARTASLPARRSAGVRSGHFRYYGTRPDDPNDIFPHEHRRELRGLSVFAAWLNHDDSRSINTLDVLVPEAGRSIVRHYLIDFGSTLGSGSTQAQTTRAGNEFLWEARPTLVTMLTLGFYVRPWVKVQYRRHPRGRPPRVDVFPAGALEARISQPGVPQRPARGPLLGRAHRLAFLRRGRACDSRLPRSSTIRGPPST